MGVYISLPVPRCLFVRGNTTDRIALAHPQNLKAPGITCHYGLPSAGPQSGVGTPFGCLQAHRVDQNPRVVGLTCCSLLLIVQILSTNLEPTLVTILRNKRSRFPWCCPIDDTEHEVRRLPRKQRNTIPVRVTSPEPTKHNFPFSFLRGGACQEQHVS